MADSATRNAAMDGWSLNDKSENQPRYDQKYRHFFYEGFTSNADAVVYYDSLRLPKERIVLSTVTSPEVPRIPSFTC